MLLTARSGTSAEYLQTTQVKFKVLDYYLEAQPGKVVEPADLAAANKDLQAQWGQIERAMNQAALTQTSKLFTRVLPPVSGNTALPTTSVLNLPSVVSPQKTRAVNVRITLVYSLAGQVVNGSISSSDPELQKFYKALDFKTLIQSMRSSGTTSLYGLSLVQGRATTANTTVPTQGLIQALSGLIGEDGQAGTSGQASPLTTHQDHLHRAGRAGQLYHYPGDHRRPLEDQPEHWRPEHGHATLSPDRRRSERPAPRWPDFLQFHQTGYCNAPHLRHAKRAVPHGHEGPVRHGGHGGPEEVGSVSSAEQNSPPTT